MRVGMRGPVPYSSCTEAVVLVAVMLSPYKETCDLMRPR